MVNIMEIKNKDNMCNKNIMEACIIRQIHVRQRQTKVVFNLLTCNWHA